MKIVIDINDNLYTRLFDNGVDNYDDAVDMAKAIRKGTPLPKGHSKLIDADKLIKSIEKKSKRLKNLDTINGLCGAVALIYDAEVIIEADKAESEV